MAFPDDHGIPEADLIRDTASDAHGGRPFGWAHEEERRAIRARLLAEGHPDDHRMIFAISREQERIAATRLTTRQRQDLARWLGLKWVTPHPSDVRRHLNFTDAELAYLADRLAGVNDPEGAAILAKIEGHIGANRPRRGL